MSKTPRLAVIVGNTRHRAPAMHKGRTERDIFGANAFVVYLRELLHERGVESDFFLRASHGSYPKVMEIVGRQVDASKPDLVLSVHARAADAEPGALALVAPKSRKAKAVGAAITAALAELGQPDLGVKVGEPNQLPLEFGATKAPVVMVELYQMLAEAGPFAAGQVDVEAVTRAIAEGVRVGLKLPVPDAE